MTEDKMVGWHHGHDGLEFGWAPSGVGDGQESLVCYHPWGRKEWGMTERLKRRNCAPSFSHVWLFATPWTVACQAPLSMGFFRQEHWSGLPFLPPGGLHD